MKIVLDFDGTIVGCEARQMSVLSTVLLRHGLRTDLKSVWKYKRAGLNTRDSLVLTGLSLDQSAEIQSAWADEVECLGWLQLDQLLPGVRDALSEWVKSGHRLTLLSARSRSEWLACQVRNLGIREYFDSIICVDPLQAVTQKTVALREVLPTFFVGDTESDWRAATNAEVGFFAVCTGQRSEAFLRAQTSATVAKELRQLF
jgi:phosphoglycolate phosphatase-like HAD superfamily hydrolase